MRKELSGNRWTDQRNNNSKKNISSDVVYVFKGVVQLFGEKDISLFSDNNNELDKESVGRGKKDITNYIKEIEIDEMCHLSVQKN